MRLHLSALLVSGMLLGLPAWAADDAGAGGRAGADARFDKTGDGVVDAEDWGKMSDAEKAAYARAALMELGLAPDAAVGGGRTRLQDYLDGLRSVYER